ncbi:hypothetical protein Slin15195_G091930 [Septoria linicola]|uniref:Uncharacterized protein n=1 Tax=Septoria linicola TaxID=215465 RepID=A0A9Q9EMV2_9PEZI|nr:hypothetical protein Slin15195_G091930 [Septoria linicola]
MSGQYPPYYANHQPHHPRPPPSPLLPTAPTRHWHFFPPDVITTWNSGQRRGWTDQMVDFKCGKGFSCWARLLLEKEYGSGESAEAFVQRYSAHPLFRYRRLPTFVPPQQAYAAAEHWNALYTVPAQPVTPQSGYAPPPCGPPQGYGTGSGYPNQVPPQGQQHIHGPQPQQPHGQTPTPSNTSRGHSNVNASSNVGQLSSQMSPLSTVSEPNGNPGVIANAGLDQGVTPSPAATPSLKGGLNLKQPPLPGAGPNAGQSGQAKTDAANSSRSSNTNLKSSSTKQPPPPTSRMERRPGQTLLATPQRTTEDAGHGFMAESRHAVRQVEELAGTSQPPPPRAGGRGGGGTPSYASAISNTRAEPPRARHDFPDIRRFAASEIDEKYQHLVLNLTEFRTPDTSVALLEDLDAAMSERRFDDVPGLIIGWVQGGMFTTPDLFIFPKSHKHAGKSTEMVIETLAEQRGEEHMRDIAREVGRDWMHSKGILPNKMNCFECDMFGRDCDGSQPCKPCEENGDYCSEVECSHTKCNPNKCVNFHDGELLDYIQEELKSRGFADTARLRELIKSATVSPVPQLIKDQSGMKHTRGRPPLMCGTPKSGRNKAHLSNGRDGNRYKKLLIDHGYDDQGDRPPILLMAINPQILHEMCSNRLRLHQPRDEERAPRRSAYNAPRGSGRSPAQPPQMTLDEYNAEQANRRLIEQQNARAAYEQPRPRQSAPIDPNSRYTGHWDSEDEDGQGGKWTSPKDIASSSPADAEAANIEQATVEDETEDAVDETEGETPAAQPAVDSDADEEPQEPTAAEELPAPAKPEEAEVKEETLA